MPASASNIIDQLCLQCGLCCNGVMFRDVELLAEDNPAVVEKAGLKVQRLKAKVRFPQPCGALCEDLRCRIYPKRPSRCRDFNCAQLQGVTAGSVTPEAALRTIAKARRLADKVRRLLRETGDMDEHRPLSLRFQSTTRRMEHGLADEDVTQIYADLTMAVFELNSLLHTAFHVSEE